MHNWDAFVWWHLSIQIHSAYKQKRAQEVNVLARFYVPFWFGYVFVRCSFVWFSSVFELDFLVLWSLLALRRSCKPIFIGGKLSVDFICLFNFKLHVVVLCHTISFHPVCVSIIYSTASSSFTSFLSLHVCTFSYENSLFLFMLLFFHLEEERMSILNFKNIKWDEHFICGFKLVFCFKISFDFFSISNNSFNIENVDELKACESRRIIGKKMLGIKLNAENDETDFCCCCCCCLCVSVFVCI